MALPEPRGAVAAALDAEPVGVAEQPDRATALMAATTQNTRARTA